MRRQAGVRETVLYYTPEKKPYEMKLKGLFVRMGIRVKTAAADEAGKRVDALMGLPGADSAASQENGASAGTGVAEGITDSDSGEQLTEDGAAMTQELLILHHFSSQRLDELLAAMRKAGIPRIALKAVVTETNRNWTLRQLYREIEEEHRRITERA